LALELLSKLGRLLRGNVAGLKLLPELVQGWGVRLRGRLLPETGRELRRNAVPVGFIPLALSQHHATGESASEGPAHRQETDQ
jgi:hypothetical protein